MTSSSEDLPVTDPLVVMASRDMNEVLAPWRRDLAVQVILYLLFSGISIAVTLETLRRREERKKAEEEHLKLRTLESVGLLAGGIAHDFNNLLTAIMGNIEMAKLSINSIDKVSDSLSQAKESCLRARELSERLITFATGGEPQRQALQIAGVIEETVTDALKDSPVKLELALQKELSLVSIDERQMKQVFLNLAMNAKEAMPLGGTLSIGAENIRLGENENPGLPAGEYVRITLRDTGVGIPMDKTPKVFDPYYTTKDKYSQKGLGLGLAVCHSIIRRHGGFISVESQEGTGTVVAVVLPSIQSMKAGAAG